MLFMTVASVLDPGRGRTTTASSSPMMMTINHGAAPVTEHSVRALIDESFAYKSCAHF